MVRDQEHTLTKKCFSTLKLNLVDFSYIQKYLFFTEFLALGAIEEAFSLYE